jgi:hypothetical protein
MLVELSVTVIVISEPAGIIELAFALPPAETAIRMARITLLIRVFTYPPV